MKQVTFAAGLIALGLVLGQAVPQVLAQTQQTEVQKWEQFCERYEGGTARKVTKQASESAAAHGQRGYQVAPVMAGGGVVVLCYRRPAQ